MKIASSPPLRAIPSYYRTGTASKKTELGVAQQPPKKLQAYTLENQIGYGSEFTQNLNKSSAVKSDNPNLTVGYRNIDDLFRAVVSNGNDNFYDQIFNRKREILKTGFNDIWFPSGGVNGGVPWGGGGNTLMDILIGPKVNSELFDLFKSMNSLKINQANFVSAMDHGQISSNDYSGFLQKGNSDLERIAGSITQGHRTQDDKMYAIREWIQDDRNLAYQTDLKNHGVNERWSLPTETIRSGVGDCEDGAFATMGLALASGVDPSRLRFYGGLVRAGTGAATGGHGWLAYQRESDDEWVVLDWCYLPNQDEINKLKPMRLDKNYISDWFVITGNGTTVDTGMVNSVRDPNKINRYDSMKNAHGTMSLGNFKSSAVATYKTHKQLIAGMMANGRKIPAMLKRGTNVLRVMGEALVRNGIQEEIMAKMRDGGGFSTYA